MDYEEILENAADEIVCQTTGKDDVSNFTRDSKGLFPLKARLDPDNVDDIVRIFQGRDDFRKLRSLLRQKAAAIYCRCAITVCEQNGIGYADIDACKRALSAGNMDSALRAVKDLVLYEMDGSIRKVFNDYHTERMSTDGMADINIKISAGNCEISLSMGDHISVLAWGRVGNPADLARLLKKALPETCDAFSCGEEHKAKRICPVL